MKLLSQNLDCHKYWRDKKNLFLRTLDSVQPDILCLQEISSKQESNNSRLFTNEGVEIGHHLNYEAYFSAAYKCSVNQGIFTDQSKIAVKDRFIFSLSGILQDGRVDRHRRFLLAEFLNISGKEVLVVNLHFSVQKDFRYKNWEEVMLWLEKSGLIKGNIIIVGDLNTYEDKDVHNQITSEGFENVWKLLKDDECVTYRSSDWWVQNYPDDLHSRRIIETRKSWPESCLDYIFIKGSIKPKSIKYLDLVPDVSDHKGLIFDFEV
jgi:endonuclease/exonuclease/phosphatase family metal-dependent hydrolase